MLICRFYKLTKLASSSLMPTLYFYRDLCLQFSSFALRDVSRCEIISQWVQEWILYVSVWGRVSCLSLSFRIQLVAELVASNALFTHMLISRGNLDTAGSKICFILCRKKIKFFSISNLVLDLCEIKNITNNLHVSHDFHVFTSIFHL